MHMCVYINYVISSVCRIYCNNVIQLDMSKHCWDYWWLSWVLTKIRLHPFRRTNFENQLSVSISAPTIPINSNEFIMFFISLISLYICLNTVWNQAIQFVIKCLTPTEIIVFLIRTNCFGWSRNWSLPCWQELAVVYVRCIFN